MSKKNLKDNLEAIYPLSPMQQGMLFHSLAAPHSEVYVEQFTCQLRGSLHVWAFEQAWQQVMARYAALRTLVVWEQVPAPLQVVQRAVPLPWTCCDWRDKDRQQQQTDLASWLHHDRCQGFQLSQAPLLRLCLIRLEEQLTQFTWSFHHLLLDGWSLSIVLTEVFARYEALCQGQNLDLPAVRPYQDYLRWLQQQDLTQALQFWHQTLAGFETPTILQGDRHRPTASSEAQVEDLLLSQACSARLHALCRTHQLTLNTLLQGAWALLLSRYSDREDIVFGVTVSGRPVELLGVQDMVGLFINTLPVRLHLQAQQPLLPWLHALQAQQSEARQYEYSPLAQVQTCSQVPAGQPLFESLLVFENYPLQSASVEQMSLSFEQGQMAERTNYPLTLLVSPGPQILLRLSAQANRYSPQWSRRLLEHLQALLEHLLSTSDQCLRQLAVLTEQEQHLLQRWNATNREEFKTGEGLHDVIERQVRQTPEAIALVCEEHWLTYDELNRQANRLAHRLQDWGVGPEVLVGICLPRSLELVIALLAVLKAGGAYVPLDPDYPQERLHYLLCDAQVAVLLTQHALEERLPPGPGRILWLDEPGPAQDLQAQQDLGVPVQGRQAVYMLYTSGSTGRPKGVKNEHAGLINRLLWMQEAYGLTPQDRVLQKTPVSFDVSVWEFFWPLQTGACLVLARPAGHREASYLGQLIEEQGVTTLHFVPSLLRVFLQEGQGSRCQSVRQVICSGEALPGDLQQQVLEEMAARLHNLYGPTEAAIDVTFWPCHPAEEVRIGWPISNTQIYLLDSWGQPVPIGQPGEIAIGGEGVARGYHQWPQRTAERFVPDPFSGRVGGRLFLTGDVGRYGADGALEYLGRRDEQVKLRGVRIELGEIEAVLMQQEGVKEAVVLLRQSEVGEPQLVAYVRGEQEAGREEKVREGLRKVLPDTMIPGRMIWVQQWPLTPNGKLDRRALPAVDQIRPEHQGTYFAPRDTLELQLVQIWEEILEVHPVSISDNFFALGGHSLIAVRLIGQIQKELGWKLPLSILLEKGNVEGLADILRQQNIPQLQSPIVPIQPQGSRRPFFCVHPGSGTALCFYDLARHLGLDQPFYGLQDPLIYEEEMVYRTIEEIAACYVGALRVIQPEGPYFLGGYSFGGIVAFEMAYQLRSQGQEVPLLIVLEGGTPISANKLPSDPDDASLLAILTMEILRGFTKKTIQDLYDELCKLESHEQLGYIVEQAKIAGFPDTGPLYIERQLQLFKFRTQAMRSYGLKTYPGQVILFRSEEKEVLETLGVQEQPTSDFGWSELSTRPIEIQVISGHHDTIVREPHVRILAQHIESHLDKYNQ